MGNSNSIYDDLPEGLLKYKKNGKIIYCNNSILSTLKYPKGKSPKTLFELIPEEYISKHHRYLKSDGIMFPDLNIRIKCYDNTLRSIKVTHLRPDTIIFKNLELSYIESLTEYKNILKESEQMCSTGYWKWNIITGSLIWSDGLKKIFEIDDVSFENYDSCVHPEDKLLLSSTIEKCIIDKKNYEIKHRLITNKTKKIKWLSSIGKYTSEAGVFYLSGIAQDITEQYNIQKTLQIKSLQAEKNLKTKTEFVASVSHELRTPLNGIVGMISLLEMTELTEKQNKYISVLSNSSGVLLSIINNILDFSKIEAGKVILDYSLFNIKQVVTKVLDLFRPMYITKNIDLFIYFEISGSDNIISDKIKISQILSNLLSNSIKFTKKGSVKVFLKISDNNLTIEVVDTGIGIDPEFIKTITEPFTQADCSTTRNYGGSGLGISIVNSYIQLLKGSLVFKSEKGVGTSVTINIPISRENINKVIVIVEDNMANQYIVKEMISELVDIPVICYDNGKHVIDEMSIEPLIIFMDLHMPLMDGHLSTVELRKKGFICPIVALTANSVKNERIKCLESGMDDFMLKPIDINDIRLILQKYKII
jgi:signal transduction histidine kinase